jgi:hypothetical protein
MLPEFVVGYYKLRLAASESNIWDSYVPLCGAEVDAESGIGSGVGRRMLNNVKSCL